MKCTLWSSVKLTIIMSVSSSIWIRVSIIWMNFFILCFCRCNIKWTADSVIYVMEKMTRCFIVKLYTISAIICVLVTSCLTDAPLNLHGPHICTKKQEWVMLIIASMIVNYNILLDNQNMTTQPSVYPCMLLGMCPVLR